MNELPYIKQVQFFEPLSARFENFVLKTSSSMLRMHRAASNNQHSEIRKPIPEMEKYLAARRYHAHNR